jgi:hypothetical protein
MNNKWTAFRRFRNWLSNLIMESDVNDCHHVRYRFVARRDNGEEFTSFDMYSFGEALRNWSRWNNADRKSKLQVRYGFLCSDPVGEDGEPMFDDNGCQIMHDDGGEWKDYDIARGPCIPRY